MIQTIFTPPHALNTAVLLIIFNRIDTTRQVFEAIRQAKPPRLYIAADGARADKPGEAERVQSVRDFVLSNIDWPCEVKTLFQATNLGCKYAVSGAITWFFENEEQGIILEDDCLPSQSFFWFCEDLLVKYKASFQVAHVGGANFQKGVKRGEADYYFSIYPQIWGWASWASRWKNYDVELTSLQNTHFIDELIKNKNVQKYWYKIFKKMKRKEIDTWDYQWMFALWNNKQLTIVPNVNMVTNIGYGIDATHTIHISDLGNIAYFDLVMKEHPEDIQANADADEFTDSEVFRIKPFFVRAVNKISRILYGKNLIT